MLQKKTINQQSLYEYLITEATYGTDTILNEVKRKKPNSYVKITKEETITTNLDFLPKPIINSKDKQSFIEKTYLELENSFMKWKNSGRTISTGLTAGFDSRLMAVIFKSINATVNYNVGGSIDCPDVVIAKEIANKENLPLFHRVLIQKDKIPKESYLQHLKMQFYRNDALGNNGIFDDGTDWSERFKQASQKELMLVGIGGEIYRNYWSLPNKQYSTDDFTKSRFDTFDDTEFTEIFDREIYLKNFSKKMREALCITNSKMKRSELEMLYPIYRMRYWAGMEVTKTSNFYPIILPFADHQICSNSSIIPVKWKRTGEFEANLIRYGDKSIASHLSEYGYSFDKPAPLKKWCTEFIREYTPISIRWSQRKKRYNIEKKLKEEQNQSSFPYFLQDEYLKTVFDLNDLHISKYIDINKIINPGLLSRALSVELILGDYF